MDRKAFTIADVQELVHAKRHVIVYWCKTLPPFCYRLTRERVARRFSRQDVVFLIAVDMLTRLHGRQTDTIFPIAMQLFDSLKRSPQELAGEHLFFPPGMRQVLLVGRTPKAQHGLLLPVDDVLAPLLQFLGLAPETAASKKVVPFRRRGARK